MDSKAIGNFVLPAMQLLPKRIPNMAAAVLCTSDGFNICALGLDETQVGKLSALSSSLLSVGGAAISELLPSKDRSALDLLTLRSEDFQIIGMKVRKAHGDLVLMVAATDVPLGVMLVGAQVVAKEIERRLGH